VTVYDQPSVSSIVVSRRSSPIVRTSSSTVIASLAAVTCSGASQRVT
jgi:hypothetical protein